MITDWIHLLKQSGYHGNYFPYESMCKHTTFKIGGIADIFLIPKTLSDMKAILSAAVLLKIPLTILGGCSNILVSDMGIRGFTVSMQRWKGIQQVNDSLCIKSGTSISDASVWAMRHSLTGLEFAYKLPGTLGGAVWMNARCYGQSIAGVLKSTKILNFGTEEKEILTVKSDFSYKKSPFQLQKCLILSSMIQLCVGEKKTIRKKMLEYSHDRIKKGHFRNPCAGSTFKNNPDFGEPTGKILDQLGLRGKSVGDAAVSEYHGNILINKGKATAAQMHTLIMEIQGIAEQKLGIHLEPEILKIGEWD